MDPAKERLIESLLSRPRLTAPHYLAYSWVCERLAGPPRSVLDFGARYSLLPSILALHGHRVTAVDRDPVVREKQAEFSREFCVSIEVVPNDRAPFPEFDAITACWAIQHNEPDKQAEIVSSLVASLVPGGKLLVVAAYTYGDSRYEGNRQDPLWRFNDEDMHKHVVKPSRCKVTDIRRFRYEHGSVEGDWCGPLDDANAIAFELTKGAK